MKLNTTNANTDRGKVLLKIYWIFKNHIGLYHCSCAQREIPFI